MCAKARGLLKAFQASLAVFCCFYFLSIQKTEALKWTKHPPKHIFVTEGANATLEWDYELDSGDPIEFARWGPVTADNSMSKFFIFKAGTSKPNVISKYKDKVSWFPNATMIIKNIDENDGGRYGCSIDTEEGEHLFGVTVLNIIQIILPNRTENRAGPVTLIKGANLTLEFHVVATPRPVVEWFKDGMKIISGVNLSTLEMKNADNSTFYTFKLYKERSHENDTGFYEAFVVFGNIRFSMMNFTVSFTEKGTEKAKAMQNSFIRRDDQRQIWLIPFVIIMASLFILLISILAIFHVSQRLRQSNQRNATKRYEFQENNGTLNIGNANKGFDYDSDSEIKKVSTESTKDENIRVEVEEDLNYQPETQYTNYLQGVREYEHDEFTIVFSDEDHSEENEKEAETVGEIKQIEEEKEKSSRRSFILPEISKKKIQGNCEGRSFQIDDFDFR